MWIHMWRASYRCQAWFHMDDQRLMELWMVALGLHVLLSELLPVLNCMVCSKHFVPPSCSSGSWFCYLPSMYYVNLNLQDKEWMNVQACLTFVWLVKDEIMKNELFCSHFLQEISRFIHYFLCNIDLMLQEQLLTPWKAFWSSPRWGLDMWQNISQVWIDSHLCLCWKND